MDIHFNEQKHGVLFKPLEFPDESISQKWNIVWTPL